VSEKRISSPLVSLIYIVHGILVLVTLNVFLSGDKTMSKLEAIGVSVGVGGVVGGLGGGVGAEGNTVAKEPFVSIVSNIAAINST